MNQASHNLPLPDDLREFARELRRRSTDAETLLWGVLRDRRFGKLKFRRQHPLAPYVLDFYCDELQWAVELDGGRHNSPRGREQDEARTNFIERHGVTVSRFWNHEVLADFEAVLEAMYRTAQRLRERKS